MLLNILVRFLELIGLSVEHIHIVLKTVVLLLSLDKGGNDLLDVRDTSSLLDLIEGILDDFDISQVLVHELSLLLVGLDDLIQSPLSNYDRVGEASSLVCVSILSSLLIEVLVIEFNHLILLFKLELQLLDDVLEFFLFFLMLRLESNDLIIGLLCNFAYRLIVLVL